MGAERIGQIEYEINDNLKVNLKTGRLLLNTNIINLFKDEYNLNLNLIYNSNNDFNPNMDSLLGLYFKFDISEYVERTGNLIYYIDSFDRHNLATTYYSNNGETHKHFGDESLQTLIVFDNDDTRILIKDNNENIKEFSKLSNQSEDTYYYVLTKKQIKLNDNTYLTYFYNYDNENRLTSIYNNIDSTRKIEFGYNKNGLINHIYINYSNKINGVRLKYDINNKIVALLNITNSIEELQYVFNYEGECLKYLVDYVNQKGYEFTFNINSKVSLIRYGKTNINIHKISSLMVSEDTYTSNQLVDNYVSDFETSYNIDNLNIASKDSIEFIYDINSDYTKVIKHNTLNSSFDLTYVYYLDALGKEVSSFIETSANRYKNTFIMKGYDLLDETSTASLKINNKKVFESNLLETTLDFDSTTLGDFIDYHNDNVNKFNGAYLVYSLSCFMQFKKVFQRNALILLVTYEDEPNNETKEVRIKLNLKQANGIQLFSSCFSLERRRVVNIQFQISSINESNNYILSNMYVTLSDINYLMIKVNNNLDLPLGCLKELNIKKYNSSSYEPIDCNNESGRTNNTFSYNDLIVSFKNYLKAMPVTSNSTYNLYYNELRSIERVKSAKIVLYYNSHDYEVEITDSLVIKTFIDKKTSNSLEQTNIYYDNNEELLIEEKSITKDTLTKTEISKYDLNNNLVYLENEDGIIKQNFYDRFNRIVRKRVYKNSLLFENINYNSESYNMFNDGYNYTKEEYDDFGKMVKYDEKSIYEDHYRKTVYDYDLKNRIKRIYSLEKPDESNVLRYNENNQVLEEANIDSDNHIINHFYKYDNIYDSTRITEYFRINSFRLNNQKSIIKYEYDDSYNTINKKIRNGPNSYEDNIYKYNKNNRLIEYQNNDKSLVYSYDGYTDLISVKQDNFSNFFTNYEYDENNKLTRKRISKGNDDYLILECLDMNNHYLLYNEFYDENQNAQSINSVYTLENDKLFNPKLSVIDNDCFDKTISYDDVNRVSEYNYVLHNAIGSSSINYTVNNSYDYLILEGLQTYLVSNSLKEISKNNIIDKFSFNYEYLEKGNLLSKHIINNTLINNGIETNKNKIEYNYAYDNLLQISNELIKRYNSDNELVKQNNNIYTYRENGNIESIRKIDDDNDITYNYLYNNSLLSRINNTSDNSYRLFSYDYYGNITEINYYDNLDNLLKKEKYSFIRGTLLDTYKLYNGSTLIKSFKYYYNGEGIRYKKEDLLNNVITEYVLDEDRVLAIYITTNSNIKRYYYLYDETGLIGFNYNNKTYYYIKNEFYDIIGIASDGVEINRYIYDAFGNVNVYKYNSNNDLVIDNDINSIGNINPYLFKGYYYDRESGLYYLKSRYYNPEVSRFISPDSIDYIDNSIINGLNLYCYCNNNPVMYSDEDGNFSTWIFLGRVAISALVNAIDTGISASISGQDFWKGFAAGAVGGAIGGAINCILPVGAYSLIGRAVGTFITDVVNEFFQTGKIDTNNWGLYLGDVILDVGYSLLYLDKVNNIIQPFISTAVGGIIDAIVDITETALYFTSEAQKSIRGNSTDKKIRLNYSNKMSYVY